jgi:hypothetical protein
MSVLLRSKAQIYGLSADLAALVLADSTELARAQAAEATLLQSVLDEQARAEAAEAALSTAIAAEATARAAAITAEEVAREASIEAAKLALGTSYRVADRTERDALTGLTLNDTVRVLDDGDAKWVVYQPGAIDAQGAATSWDVLMDEDMFLNANTASSIKTAYESNSDTNAFTDAEQAKLALVSATSAIDLDKVIQSDELLTSGTLAGATDTSIASALAIKTYVDSAATTGGARFATESLVVVGDRIVLANVPKDGQVLNFGTVRHVDVNGVAWDVPVIADGGDISGKTYILAADSAGQFDTQSVLVQYPYVAA